MKAGSSSAADVRRYAFSEHDITFFKWLLFFGFGFKIPI
jgi:hypothetical protein